VVTEVNDHNVVHYTYKLNDQAVLQNLAFYSKEQAASRAEAISGRSSDPWVWNGVVVPESLADDPLDYTINPTTPQTFPESLGFGTKQFFPGTKISVHYDSLPSPSASQPAGPAASEEELIEKKAQDATRTIIDDFNLLLAENDLSECQDKPTRADRLRCLVNSKMLKTSLNHPFKSAGMMGNAYTRGWFDNIHVTTVDGRSGVSWREPGFIYQSSDSTEATFHFIPLSWVTSAQVRIIMGVEVSWLVGV
jgi:hypothetical protein